jgi:TolA-binding protein
MKFNMKPVLSAILAAGLIAPAMADDAAMLRQMQEQMKQMQAQIEAMTKKLAAQGEKQVKTETETKARDKALQVYGRVQVSVDNYSDDFGNGSKGTTAKSNSSYIGMKGATPTMFEGTDLIYQAEMRYGAADEESAEIVFREGFAGLKGGWGQTRIGRLSVPYKATLTKIDPWLDLQPQSRGYGGRLGSSALHSSYFNNAFDYVSPKFGGGFTGAVWHSEQLDGETNNVHNAGPLTNFKGGTASGLGAKFEQGAWFVGADWVDVDADNSTSANMTNGDGWQLAARYNPGPWSVSLMYEDVEDIGMGTNLYVNGIYKIGKARLIATVGQNRDAKVYGNRDIDTWSLGARYPLNKTSDVFAAYVNRAEDAFGATPAKDFNVFTVGVNAYFSK